MNKKLSFIILLLLGGLCLLGLPGQAMAQQQTHVVQKGETLFSIASRYDVTVEKLKKWNGLESPELEVGRELIVQPPAQQERQEGEGHVVHTVKEQETLYSISKQYGVSITELKSWNELSGNTLEVGQKLKIYRNDPNRNGGNTSRQSIVTSGNTQNNTYYTVKSGDTLYQIARAHNMTVTELKELNDLRSNTIAVGQELTVRRQSAAPPSVAEADTGPGIDSSPQGKFVQHTVEQSTPLADLLKKFKMDKPEFLALNPDIADSTFRRGQKVTVLAPATRSYDNPYLSGSSLKTLGETTVSRYDSVQAGKTTTSGELYSPGEFTAAHSNITIGTVIYVQNPANNRGIYIRINDRISNNGLKLSSAAWQALDLSGTEHKVKIFQDQ